MARNSQNLGGVYANMDFPPYVWTEFPKHIKTGPYGQYEVAKTATEEKEILTKLQKEHDNTPAEVIHYASDPAKEILISRARELEVPINIKWSKTKLQAVVDEAEKAIDDLPAEGATLPKVMVLEEIETPATVEELENEKTTLYNEAKALGLKTTGMHLWGIPRLKAAIIEAKAAAGDE